jgi:hypothetical protein
VIDNGGRPWISVRWGPDSRSPFSAGQLVATFPVLDTLRLDTDHGNHEHPHLVDEVGPAAAAQIQRELQHDAGRYGVPADWATDAQAVSAAEILHRAKVGGDNCRQLPEASVYCSCRSGVSKGARPLLRGFVVDGERWLLTSSFETGNRQTGRVNVPALAERMPTAHTTHVHSLIAICKFCMHGVLARPRRAGVVLISRLGAPTFGRVAD